MHASQSTCLTYASTLLRSSRSPTSVGAHSVPVGNTLADTELLPDATEGVIVHEDGDRGQGQGQGRKKIWP